MPTVCIRQGCTNHVPYLGVIEVVGGSDDDVIASGPSSVPVVNGIPHSDGGAASGCRSRQIRPGHRTHEAVQPQPTGVRDGETLLA